MLPDVDEFIAQWRVMLWPWAFGDCLTDNPQRDASRRYLQKTLNVLAYGREPEHVGKMLFEFAEAGAPEHAELADFVRFCREQQQEQDERWLQSTLAGWHTSNVKD